MSPGTIRSRGTLWSLPVEQCKKRWTKGSSKRGTNDNFMAFQRRSSRVALTNCPAHRALVFSLSASAAYARDCVCRLPISSSTRVAQFRVRCTEQPGGQRTSYGGDRGVNSDIRTRESLSSISLLGWRFHVHFSSLRFTTTPLKNVKMTEMPYFFSIPC